MNWDQFEGNWKQLSGKAKERWGKLTVIQERYGIKKEEAQKELDEFYKLQSEHAAMKSHTV